LSLQDRGLLGEGYFAVVVVFGPATVADPAVFSEAVIEHVPPEPAGWAGR
jgi:N-acyl-D-aspartate/D-glutamate deacylase